MRTIIFSIITILIISATVFIGQTPKEEPTKGKYVLVIHGGAGNADKNMPTELKEKYLSSLESALQIGKKILESGGSSLDAVEQVVRFLEDDSLFNAGRGAVLTSEGVAELDASIMYGKDLSTGAVANVKRVKNPITAARTVMEKSNHVLLVSDGAEKFAKSKGLEMVDPSYFITSEEYERWTKKKESEKKGTVGAVALDMAGNISAATSTGGMFYKLPGRVGDAPLVNAGTYANNKTAGISCTGWGERFIKNTVAFNVSALMEYKGYTLKEAVDEMIHKRLQKGDGGLIAIDKHGNFELSYSTNAMFRGAINSDGKKIVKIWE
ncbi:MAG: beta-aspartyl-peptidase [Chlorobiaceae bacterium]|nr:beta-aspartyl-peptidase [Chlorobiaceae bacterium]MBA4309929.1 beta-aspartyl-peptidase [Chlorobiaceae bacterium]